MGLGAGGGAGSGRGKFSGKKCRLICMFCLTTVFFLLEIVTGYVTNSMALVADSFHMLSDIAALVIAFISVRMAPKSWSKNTFGWARAEVLGALVNAVFLVALCFSITVESMKRFYEPEEIHNPVMILYVGGMGLAVNLVGLCLFHEHGSSHGHSHGLTRSTHSHLTDLQDREEKDAEISEIYPARHETVPKHAHGHSHDASNMNMRGVFLHVMADALGSVVVIISAVIMWQTDWEYKLYVDPGLSLLLVILILRSVWPLLIDSALILLQTVPTHIQVDTLQRKLMEKVDGILAVHEFHVWQLTGDRIIASAHIRCLNLAQYMEVAEKVKEFFHHEGIHSTTIQPEFIETMPHSKLASTEDCVLACPKLPKNVLAGCEANRCCPPGSKTSSGGGATTPTALRRPSSISISAETAKGLSALLAGSQSRQSAPNLSLEEEEGRSSANTSSNNSTEMTAQFNLSDSPRLSNTNTIMKNTEIPLSISQFTPVKPVHTSSARNTPDRQTNPPTRHLTAPGGGAGGISPALMAAMGRYSSSNSVGDAPPPPLNPSQLDAQFVAATPPGDVQQQQPVRKTSSNSSTGGEDYDEGEHTPMVPRTKTRLVRVTSKQSNV